MSIPVWNKGQIEKDSPPLYLLVTQSIEGANSSKSRRPFHEGGKGSSSFLDETQRGNTGASRWQRREYRVCTMVISSFHDDSHAIRDNLADN